MLGPVRTAGTWMLCLGAALVAQAPQTLEQALAHFPDDSLPSLLGRLAAGDPAAGAGLRELGRAAHEALLGAVLDPRFPKGRELTQAFGAFDASCGWTLPLLGDPEVLLTQEVQDLLLRLGPAAEPLLPELRTRAATPHGGHLREFVERLTAATDGPVPSGTPPSRPAVARELVPALLDCLRLGPAEHRWPALQALLGVGDDAATEAAEVLLRLSLQPECEQQAEDLLLTVRCIYSTRCLQGPAPLQRLPTEDLPPQARRLALAGRVLDVHAAEVWQRSPDVGLRRTAALVAARNGLPNHLLPLPRAMDTDATVQATVDLVRALRRRDGATAAQDLLPMLLGAAENRSLEALHLLARHDLLDAPEALWQVVIEIVTAPEVTDSPPDLPLLRERRSAALWLLDRALAADPVPALLVANLPSLTAGDVGGRRLRTFLEHADLTALELHVRAASEDPAALAPWLAALRRAGQPFRREVLDALVTELAPGVPNLPPEAQLDWLELERNTPVPDAIWRALLADANVAIRRRATEAAWRGFHLRPLPLELVLPLLADADPQVARNATFVLAGTKNERGRAVEALVTAFPAANAQLQQWLVSALWSQREVAAPARATIDAAFASEHPKVRVHAAMLRLHFDRADATALAGLLSLATHTDAEVRQHALYQAGNDEGVAMHLVDTAIAALADADEHVAYAAARLLDRAPTAKDRSLPALRAAFARAQRGSGLAQRIEQAITSLERPNAATATDR